MKKKNFIFTAISIGSRLVAGLLLFVLLARLWGPADLGLFSFVFGLSMLLILLVDFGFASYLLREIGAEPSHLAPVFRDGLHAKSVLVIPFAIIGGLVVWLSGTAAPWEMALPMLLAALFLSFGEYFIAPLRALGRYDLEATVITSSNRINFIIAGGAAWLGGSPFDVAWVSLLARVQYFFTAAWVLYRVAPEIAQYRADRTPVRQTFRRALPYGADEFLSTSWNQLDVVIVGSIFGAHALGIYAAGQKMIQGFYTLAQVVGNVMIPRLARLAHTRNQDLARSALITMASLSVIGLTFALPLWLWADELPGLLFGARFAELEGLLPLFALILLLKYISAGSGVVMTAVGKQKFRAISQALGIAIFLIGAWFVATFNLSVAALLLAYAAGVLTVVIAFQIGWRRVSLSI